VPIIRYEGREYPYEEGETVLQALERHGVPLPSSCRAGACQTCLVRALEGMPPKEAQKGLKDTQIAQGYFLACIAKPKGDLTIALADARAEWKAKILQRRMLNRDVLGLWLSRPDGFDYEAGQFINLKHDGIVRSYSLASLPSEATLELHIKRVPNGKMTGWLHDAVREGDWIEFTGPAGDSFYIPGRPEQPLLLAGVGTGLAPLYGIARAAIEAGHTAPIHLFHGALHRDALYYEDELRQLAQTHDNFHYHPCVLEGPAPEGGIVGDARTIPVEHLGGDLTGWRAYLCGDPPFVEALRRRVFLAGVGMKDIYTDPFTPAAQ